MPETICLFNQKGGSGKSTSTILLALGIAEMTKHKVGILDRDPEDELRAIARQTSLVAPRHLEPMAPPWAGNAEDSPTDPFVVRGSRIIPGDGQRAALSRSQFNSLIGQAVPAFQVPDHVGRENSRARLI